MKTLLSLLLTLSCAVFTTSPLIAATKAKTPKADHSIDQIIAVVNDDVITTSELNHAMGTIKMQIAQEHMPTPPPAVLKKQVLDQLINRRLQLQIAKQAGVQISDEELEQTINHVAEQNNISVSALYERIAQEGLSSTDYRNEMRDQMTMQRLQQQEVAGKIIVSPHELNNFIKSKSWQTNNNKEYHIEDILIPLSDTPSPADIATAKQKAEAAVTKLHQGTSFQAVAQAESGDKNALQGGDLGWRKLPEIPTAFAEQISHMHPKDIAGPIQTPNGFHIILLAEERAGEKEAMPDRKQIENLLLQQKFEEAVQNWVSKLRSQAFIMSNLNK